MFMNVIRYALLIFLITIFQPVRHGMAQDSSFWAGVLPDTVGCWTFNQPIDIPESDHLYHSSVNIPTVPGQSEGFVNRIYSCDGQSDIVLDIFEMGSVAVQSLNHFPEEFQKGDTVLADMQYVNGALTFWKDQFYISITSSMESRELKEKKFELAYSVADALVHKEQKAGIISIIPVMPGLKPDVRFFDYYLLFDAFTPFSNSEVLNIGPAFPAVSALYEMDGKGVVVVLVEYDSKERAERVCSILKEKSFDDVSKNIDQISDGVWRGVEQYDNFLMIIPEAQNPSQIKTLMKKMSESLYK